MKKVLIYLMVIFIFVMTLFNIRCEEVLIRINAVKQTKTTKPNKKTGDIKKEENVRIVIMNNGYTSIYHSDISFSSDSLFVYYGKKYSNKKSCKKITIKKDGKLFKDNNVLKVESKSAIKWKGHNTQSGSPTYEGIFYIYNTKKGLVAVNELDMESYVAGVISSEIGEESPIEALKAQAVCARTYIKQSNAEKYKKYKANADDSTNYQVYNRIAPGKNSKKAAKDTKDMVMTYEGNLIKAYYFSTSCGYTTNYKIWGKDKLGYLQGSCISDSNTSEIKKEKNFKKFIMATPDAYEKDCSFYRWNIYLTKEQIENSVYKNMGISTGDIKKIEVNSRGSGGIASQITIYGKDRQVAISNQNQIRKALISSYAELNLNDGSTRTNMEMLPSAFIYIKNIYKLGKVCGFKIYGGGFGHGSGMSQNGAIEMAKQGLGFEQILKSFYKDIEISQ